MRRLVFMILALGLVLSAYAQDDEDTLADVGDDITVDFAVLPSGVYVPPSFQIAGVTFFSHSGTDPDSAQPHIADWPPLGRSYVFPDEGVTVVLPLEAERVEIALCLGYSDVTIEALSSAGNSLSRQVIPVGCAEISINSFSLEQISVVRLTGGGYESSIAWLSANVIPLTQRVGHALANSTGTGAGFATLSAGENHTCRILDTGAVGCWGDDNYHQSSPPPGTFVSVSAGDRHTCGIRPTGTVECWGASVGAIGNFLGYESNSPSGTFTSISAGNAYTCGVRPTGAVECWGYNAHGQASPPAGTFASVSAGRVYTCGVRPTGAVECWGSDGHGESSPPPPADTFTSVSAGIGIRGHTCGVRTNGWVECWGWDSQGQASPPSGTFIFVSTGGSHTCGMRPTGVVECWGLDTQDQASPPSGTFTSISAGGSHTCGMRPTGAVECWGLNDKGQSSPR